MMDVEYEDGQHRADDRNSDHDCTPAAASSSSSQRERYSIVLFYKYFSPTRYPLLSKYPKFYETKILEHQKRLCAKLDLKGRLLIASEGVNGTLSAVSRSKIREYIDRVEAFDLLKDCGFPPHYCPDDEGGEVPPHSIFENIDWKESSFDVNGSCAGKDGGDEKKDGEEGTFVEPFPDLKVTVVKEIINSGDAVSVRDIETYGGRHLTPRQFHEAISASSSGGGPGGDDVVIIDVRNTFEYDIGHFDGAINPRMNNFSSFDAMFCKSRREELKNKKVLMYCTGGIRCEKASAMLRKNWGVDDVSQLKGGIHRYLEEYGDEGHFRGLNFVFDQRVAMHPSECKQQSSSSSSQGQQRRKVTTEEEEQICSCGGQSRPASRRDDVVGKCIECSSPFDELSGSRICTVCRDLVLVCPTCECSLREYHCARHADWKRCYFTFLEVFDVDELRAQKTQLTALRDSKYVPPAQNRNVRKTISRQMEKIEKRVQELEAGDGSVDRKAPRRCRTCSDPVTKCDGRCWGFWKRTHNRTSRPAAAATGGADLRAATGTREDVVDGDNSEAEDSPLPVSVGDNVEPGLHWNTLRLGSRNGPRGGEHSCLRRGVVVEVKSWGAGGNERDCVVVKWDDDDSDRPAQIYRWGVLALNGERMYDLRKV